jgi:hypothetical protein
MMLNEDIWFEIIQYIDTQTITSLLQTSRTYHSLFQHEHIWSFLIQRDFTDDEIHYSQSLSSSSNDEIYKYLYKTFRVFPYIFPPETGTVLPDNYNLLKVLVTSNFDSIKSMMWILFSTGEWEENIIQPLEIDFRTLPLLPKKENDVENKVTKIQWWVSSENSRFRTTTANYFRGANMILCGYDIAAPDSLSDALYWIRESNRCVTSAISIYLIGIGKTGDKIMSQNMTKQDIIKCCQENNTHYFEVHRQSYVHDTRVVLNHFLQCQKQLTHKQHIDPIVVPRPTNKSNKCCFQYLYPYQQFIGLGLLYIIIDRVHIQQN